MRCYGERMKRTTISLPDDLALVVERESRRRGVSISALVRESLAARLGLDTDGARREVPFAGLMTTGDPLPAERAEDALARHWAQAIEADRE